MKHLDAVLGGYLGYVPAPAELRIALAREGETEVPRATHRGWTNKTALDRTPDALLRIARYYDGRTDAENNTIDGNALREYLEQEFGYGIDQDFGGLATRKETTTKTQAQRESKLRPGARRSR